LSWELRLQIEAKERLFVFGEAAQDLLESQELGSRMIDDEDWPDSDTPEMDSE
jgi:hypothetical protein